MEGFPCDLDIGARLNLTLSDCYPNRYTCDSGQCIDLARRCDTVNDCDDESDEVDCFYLQFPSTYQSEIAPKNLDRDSPLYVYINVTILALPSIETVGLKFTADYYLHLRWFDQRLNFRDLNKVGWMG